jgi:hypothetical protein
VAPGKARAIPAGVPGGVSLHHHLYLNCEQAMTATKTDSPLAPKRIRDFSIEPSIRIQLFEYGDDFTNRFSMVRISAKTHAGTWIVVALKPRQWQALLHALIDIQHEMTVGRLVRREG